MKILSAVAAIIFLFAVGAMAQTTNDLSDAETQGRSLARQLLELSPITNSVQNGILTIRDRKGKQTVFSLRCEVVITTKNWQSIYETVMTNSDGYTDGNYLKIVHAENQPDEYSWNNLNSPNIARGRSNLWNTKWSGTKFIIPFFQSDFWAVDLGLEFLHWPGQKILKKEVRKTRSCNVLESTNPNPSANGYSHVVSWVDEESDGIVHAEAYDSKNKLLKVFDIKSIEKKNGMWQPELMEMENVQTGSRTWIDFNTAPLHPPKN